MSDSHSTLIIDWKMRTRIVDLAPESASVHSTSRGGTETLMNSGNTRPRNWILAISRSRCHARMSRKQDYGEEYSPEETAQRQDEAIRRALNPPLKPQSEIVSKSPAKGAGRPHNQITIAGKTVEMAKAYQLALSPVPLQQQVDK
jgi:hypothetical protein